MNTDERTRAHSRIYRDDESSILEIRSSCTALASRTALRRSEYTHGTRRVSRWTMLTLSIVKYPHIGQSQSKRESEQRECAHTPKPTPAAPRTQEGERHTAWPAGARRVLSPVGRVGAGANRRRRITPLTSHIISAGSRSQSSALHLLGISHTAPAGQLLAPSVRSEPKAPKRHQSSKLVGGACLAGGCSLSC